MMIHNTNKIPCQFYFFLTNFWFLGQFSHFNVKHFNEEISITLENAKQSTRDLVGMQLWRGAFLLSDYIMDNAVSFKDKVILELAAGTGFTSLIAAKWAKKVICTDIDHGYILPLIKSNFQRNSNLAKDFTVQELDFFKTDWRLNFETCIESIDIILVADAIYNEDITNAFFNTIEYFFQMCDKHLKIFVSMEKRWWVAESGIRHAPSYDNFMLHLHELERKFKPNIQFIPNHSVNHCLSEYYSRTEDLILMMLSKSY